jgi:hypothetical protein
VSLMEASALPRCCEFRGLRYPGDDTRRCHRHATEEQRAFAAELDARAPAVGIQPGGASGPGWPYGPNIDVEARQGLLEWAEPLGLRLSKAGHCVRWIRGQRCRPCGPRKHWLDHVTAWNHDRKPAVLLAQPYGLGSDDVAELEALEDDGFVVVIGDGWYGHGTTSVAVWRAEQAERCGVDLD